MRRQNETDIRLLLYEYHNMHFEGCPSSSFSVTCFICWTKRRNWKLKSRKWLPVVSIMNALDLYLKIHPRTYLMRLCLWWIEGRPVINLKSKKTTFIYSGIMKCMVCSMFLVVHMRLYNAEARVPFHRWGNWASERFLLADSYMGGQKEKYNEIQNSKMTGL